ncbi:unnamed protein product, partial [Symbiodinium microadriaticum]
PQPVRLDRGLRASKYLRLSGRRDAPLPRSTFPRTSGGEVPSNSTWSSISLGCSGYGLVGAS